MNEKNKEFWDKFLKNTLCEDDEETDFCMKQIICNLSNKRDSLDRYLLSDLNSTNSILNKIKERQNLNCIQDKKVESSDNTNPEHYKKLNVETIDLIQNTINDYPDVFLGYLASNVIKYLMRFQYKGKPLEDLNKAIWYSAKAKDYVAEKTNIEEKKKTNNLTAEEKKAWILENCINDEGDIDLKNLDFSDFYGDVYIDGMKVKGNLWQGRQKVEGSLWQGEQKVKGDLYQAHQEVQGNLEQGRQKVEGSLWQGRQKVEGSLWQGEQKVKGDLYQALQEVQGNLIQNIQQVQGDLYQDYQTVQGNLFQDYQTVQGNLFQDYQTVQSSLFQNYQKVQGKIYQDEKKTNQREM